MPKFYKNKKDGVFRVIQNNSFIGLDGKPTVKKEAKFKTEKEVDEFIKKAEAGTLKSKK